MIFFITSDCKIFVILILLLLLLLLLVDAVLLLLLFIRMALKKLVRIYFSYFFLKPEFEINNKEIRNRRSEDLSLCFFLMEILNFYFLIHSTTFTIRINAISRIRKEIFCIVLLVFVCNAKPIYICHILSRELKLELELV